MNHNPISRRDAMARLTALGCALAAAPLTAHAQEPAATPVATPPLAQPGPLPHCGILYDVGTRVDDDITTRPDSHRAFLQGEIETLRDDLHCSTVAIFGGSLDRLIEGATAVVETGLNVRVQPRLVDATTEEMLQQVADVANAVEPLRDSGVDVIFDVGCELTLLGSGIIPGATFAERFATLMDHLDELPAYNEQLNTVLDQAVAGARESFGGRITYGSGSWETVDWSRFDIVGVDLYRDTTNADDYANLLQSYTQYGKPVWITEFGCCCYEGAEDKGGTGFDIVDWTATPPEIPEAYTRSEAVQASYILDLLDLHQQHGINGSFIYQFIEPALTHDPNDPHHDLDMASYGVVKTYPAGTANAYEESGYWEPKEAFAAIGERYGALIGQPGATPVASR